jgi:hypothetical protein
VERYSSQLVSCCLVAMPPLHSTNLVQRSGLCSRQVIPVDLAPPKLTPSQASITLTQLFNRLCSIVPPSLCFYHPSTHSTSTSRAHISHFHACSRVLQSLTPRSLAPADPFLSSLTSLSGHYASPRGALLSSPVHETHVAEPAAESALPLPL